MEPGLCSRWCWHSCSYCQPSPLTRVEGGVPGSTSTDPGWQPQSFYACRLSVPGATERWQCRLFVFIRTALFVRCRLRIYLRRLNTMGPVTKREVFHVTLPYFDCTYTQSVPGPGNPSRKGLPVSRTSPGSINEVRVGKFYWRSCNDSPSPVRLHSNIL